MSAIATTTMSTLSTSKYHPKNIMSAINKVYGKCYNEINSSPKVQKLLMQLWNTKPELSMTSFIISSFSNYVNDENKYAMFNYIGRFQKVFASKNQSWKQKLVNFLCICTQFMKDTIKQTGINFVVKLTQKEKNDDHYITNEEVYNLFNDMAPVVYSHQLNKNTFALMFLNNDDAKDIHSKIDKLILCVEDTMDFSISSSFIMPSVKCRSSKYVWGKKTHDECVLIPFKKTTEMSIAQIMETSEYYKKQFNV